MHSRYHEYPVHIQHALIYPKHSRKAGSIICVLPIPDMQMM